VLVILWGAYVRASGSGAGCGEHWPLCNGSIVPRNPTVATGIEYAHRLTSGLCLVFVGALAWRARKIFPPRHAVRFFAVLAFFLVVMEALIGAGLVLFELVAHNKSVARAMSISVHLVNTLLLIGSIAACACFAGTARTLGEIRAGTKNSVSRLGLIALGWILLVGASGAITALGDTLFPTTSLVHGISQDLGIASHFLIKLRIFHPIFAIVGAFLAIAFARALPSSPRTSKLIWLVLGQLVLGATNILLLAPIPTQLAHLLMADLIWILMVALLCESVLDPGFQPDQTPVLAAGRVTSEHA